MTEEQLANLLVVAAKVANSAPRKQGQYVHAAQIPWSYIRELREVLDAVNMPWDRS